MMEKESDGFGCIFKDTIFVSVGLASIITRKSAEFLKGLSREAEEAWGDAVVRVEDLRERSGIDRRLEEIKGRLKNSGDALLKKVDIPTIKGRLNNPHRLERIKGIFKKV